MRAFVLLGCLLLAQSATAQPVLKSVQIAEFATGLAEPHDAAFSPDGKHIFLTDMRNSRMVVLEAMTLKLAGSFGDKELSYPHDAEFDKAGRLLVADTGNNRIAIYEVNGAQAKLVGELKGLAGPEGVAVAPDGRVIVTNTRNANLSVFRDGKLERTVGGYGSRDGEFANPHDVEAAADGSIWVVDSGNDRVQVFDGNGKYETQWVNMHRPCGLYCCRGPKLQFLIGELGPNMSVNRNLPNIGPRLTIVDAKGATLARLGGEAGPGLETGKFVAPHGLAVDSRGDIYVGEVSYTEYPRLFPDQPIPWRMRSLQKLEKLA